MPDPDVFDVEGLHGFPLGEKLLERVVAAGYTNRPGIVEACVSGAIYQIDGVGVGNAKKLINWADGGGEAEAVEGVAENQSQERPTQPPPEAEAAYKLVPQDSEEALAVEPRAAECIKDSDARFRAQQAEVESKLDLKLVGPSLDVKPSEPISPFVQGLKELDDDREAAERLAQSAEVGFVEPLEIPAGAPKLLEQLDQISLLETRGNAPTGVAGGTGECLETSAPTVGATPARESVPPGAAPFDLAPMTGEVRDLVTDLRECAGYEDPADLVSKLFAGFMINDPETAEAVCHAIAEIEAQADLARRYKSGWDGAIRTLKRARSLLRGKQMAYLREHGEEGRKADFGTCKMHLADHGLKVAGDPDLDAMPAWALADRELVRMKPEPSRSGLAKRIEAEGPIAGVPTEPDVRLTIRYSGHIQIEQGRE